MQQVVVRDILDFVKQESVNWVIFFCYLDWLFAAKEFTQKVFSWRMLVYAVMFIEIFVLRGEVC